MSLLWLLACSRMPCDRGAPRFALDTDPAQTLYVGTNELNVRWGGKKVTALQVVGARYAPFEVVFSTSLAAPSVCEEDSLWHDVLAVEVEVESPVAPACEELGVSLQYRDDRSGGVDLGGVPSLPSPHPEYGEMWELCP